MRTTVATTTPATAAPATEPVVVVPTRRRRGAGSRDHLERAVTDAVRDLRAVDTDGLRERYTRCRRVETALRAALERQVALGPSDAAPAVTIACAYLTATDVEEAYHALLVAADRLRRR
ncbi:hypothetical protein WCD74_03625 [Actinomycetospora sp. OC33-EN08]|uniref:Uncharacterized protein n=1 Tax=Actinomycetospora aurantiaca TaxID=3129233 RepID=A0ABU8MHS0_9PSEU